MFGKTTALAVQVAETDRRIEQRFHDLDRLLDQRFETQQRAIDVAAAAIEEQTAAHVAAHEREHREQGNTFDKLEKRIDQRLSELRVSQETIERDRGDYVRRDVLDQKIQGIEAGLNRIEQEKIAPIETWRIDLTGKLVWWALVFLFCTSLVSIALVAVVLSVFGG